MRLRTYELHPMLIHAPLALLPAAALADLYAASRGTSGRAGRTLWAATAVSGLAAGAAGMAASQEIQVPDRRAKDMMWLHGLGNVTLVAAAIGVAAWRRRRGPSLVTGLLGLGAMAASWYTAWLGGEMVYAYGMGVKALETEEEAETAPPLFSTQAPGVLAKDAVAGAKWIATRTKAAVSREEGVETGAFGPEAAQRMGSHVVPVETGAYPS
jgi:uncharacterized membrane protein